MQTYWVCRAQEENKPEAHAGARLSGGAAELALYSLQVKAVSRSTGRSAVAAAAYRAAEQITDARTGLTHDYTRKGGVVHSEIMTPADAPAWVQDRAALWNAAEAAENRKNSTTGRDIILALPHELTDMERLAVTRELAAYLVERHGVAVDFAIHRPDRDGDNRNHHAHLLMTTRRVTPSGFGEKTRELDEIKSGGAVTALREKWASIANAALERGGHAARVDHRSNEARGIESEPTLHLGPDASAMERKGKATELGDRNRAAHAANDNRDRLKAELAAVNGELADIAEVIDLSAERQARVEAESERRRSLVNPDGTLNYRAVLDRLTRTASTFDRKEVERAIASLYPDRGERREAAAALLADSAVIGLCEATDSPVTRYTTREVLTDERQVLRAAAAMDARAGFGLSEAAQRATLDRHSHLDAEQRTAFTAAIRAGGFAMVAGEAGTGKSTTITAIRDAYEREGFHVIGMSWTNAVVQDMAADGFTDARTVASEFHRMGKGGCQGADWHSRTVIVVDEAAMLSTKAMGDLMTRAEAAGAKVVMVGDDQQLASIERGGMFGALRQERGAAELAQVYRVKDDEQRAAFNAMHAGDFRTAVNIFDRRGAIRWTSSMEDARAALVEKWAADTAGAPEKSRFVFAYTNQEVLELNAQLREVRVARGELGADHQLKTHDGAAGFAAGDRLQFTGGSYSREQKKTGLVNGAVGTITAIDGVHVTVELDGKAGRPPRVVSFTAGENREAGELASFRHGYAGTIYKGQGRTLDETYLAHSEHWRSASSYVALSRHRADTAIFVAQEVAEDCPTLAAQMARTEEKRAASQFILDPATTLSGDGQADRAAPGARAINSSQEGGAMSATPEEQRLAAEVKAAEALANVRENIANRRTTEAANGTAPPRQAETWTQVQADTSDGRRMTATGLYESGAAQDRREHAEALERGAQREAITEAAAHAAYLADDSQAINTAEAADLAKIAAQRAKIAVQRENGGNSAPAAQQPQPAQPAQAEAQKAAEPSAIDPERQRLLDGLNKAQEQKDRLNGTERAEGAAAEDKKPSLAEMRAASDRKAAEERKREQEQGITGPRPYRGMSM